MRSIRYLLTGRPRTVADALHFSDTQRPCRVTVDVSLEQFPTDQTVLVEVVAWYRWSFPSLTATCKEVCGGFSILDDSRTRCLRVAQANERLRRRVQGIEDRQIPVAGMTEGLREPNLAAAGARA